MGLSSGLILPGNELFTPGDTARRLNADAASGPYSEVAFRFMRAS